MVSLKIIQLEDSHYSEFNDKIPLNWYSLYLSTNLGCLTEEYQLDDFKKLYEEILQDETKEIDLLNTRSQQIITKYGLNIRTIEKIIEKYKRDYVKVKQIEKYIKINHFILSNKVEVCVKLNQQESGESSGNLFSSIKSLNKQNSFNLIQEELGIISVKKTSNCLHKRLLYLEKITEGKIEKKSKSLKGMQDVINP